MIRLRKILTERLELKILRQQIFSLTKTKGGWLTTTHLVCWFEIEISKYNLAEPVVDRRDQIIWAAFFNKKT